MKSIFKINKVSTVTFELRSEMHEKGKQLQITRLTSQVKSLKQSFYTDDDYDGVSSHALIYISTFLRICIL